MCPRPPILASLDYNLDPGSTDEELIMFLCKWEISDPLPQNVLTDVNPSAMDPHESFENAWYLYSLESEDPQPSSRVNRNDTRLTKRGYWIYKSSSRVQASSVATGTKSSLEYFEGREPTGERTGWTIYEYHAVNKDEEISAVHQVQDAWFLCRVFQDSKMKAGNEELHHSKNEDADAVFLKNYPLYLRDFQDQKGDELKFEFQNVVLGRSGTSGKEFCQQIYDEHATTCGAYDDISEDDYVEINDLLSADFSSVSSDNSITTSVNYDDCFDPEAVLKELGHFSDSKVDEEHGNSHLSVSLLATSDHVVAVPSEAGAIHKHEDKDPEVGALPVNSTIAVQLQTPLSQMSKNQPSSDLLVVTSSGLLKRSHSGGSPTSRGGKSPQREGKNSSRLTKFGKKYCCFGSF